ncbi:hypothetical protein PHSY_001392 [Pseudozyma hubeiensis SY62]|uniref:MutL C-terminal dimerisation domain-containing protein n=1 Tax=Pseudozyma hubeiensis (strain SY62) TaxID=1305764 RepID=R9NYW2_PSEHS|nr:hypothetical protein PHSY_001392 [Pseudozyma hubeiensis SY62]GAC93827.1 hypothetical protein PHSY_001392 [Pseudozyma hubeiensis SY62]
MTSRKRKRSSRPSTACDIEAKDEPSTLLRARPATASLAVESYGPAAAVPEGMVEWRHPVSGRSFHIDQRTGHSTAVIPRSLSKDDDGGSVSERIRGLYGGVGVDRTKLKRSLGLLIPDRGFRAGRDEVDSMDEFDDPSFDAALAAMPSPSHTATSDLVWRSRFFDSCRSASLVKIAAREPLHHDDSDVGSMTRRKDVVELAITRLDLQTAHVLNQVDGKLILCSTSSTSSKTNGVVFCIDQHAADERYRLEHLLEQYLADCAAETALYQLESTITLPISMQQYDLIKGTPAVESHMKMLGWSIKAIVMIHPTLGHAQVDLDGIPYILKDKALTDRGKVKDQSLLQKCFTDCLDSSDRLFEVKIGEDCVYELFIASLVGGGSHLVVANSVFQSISIDALYRAREMISTLCLLFDLSHVLLRGYDRCLSQH